MKAKRQIVTVAGRRICTRCGKEVRTEPARKRTASLRTSTPKPASRSSKPVTTADSAVPAAPSLLTAIRRHRGETSEGKILTAVAPPTSLSPAPGRTQYADPPPSLERAIKAARGAA